MQTRGPDDSAAQRSWLKVKLAAAWALVGLPLAWGVSQVVVKSLDLFQ